MSELLECCRVDYKLPDRRHLRVMDTDRALCGARAPLGAGAGHFSTLLQWPTCTRCRSAAEAMGPHPKQADNAPVTLNLGGLV